MDNLKEIILTFSKEEQQEIVIFMQRSKKQKYRKDEALFLLLTEDVNFTQREIIQKVGTKNANAYHTIRKRLFKIIAEFILLKSQEEKTDESSHVQSLINIANYLFRNEVIDLAWKYILKGERIALQNEQYDALNSIYLIQLEQATTNQNIDIHQLIIKYNQNSKLRLLEEKFLVVKSLLTVRLQEYKYSGKTLNIHAEMNSILNQYGLEEKVYEQPKLVYRFLQIIRAGIIETKAFYKFEPYVTSVYKKLYSDESSFEKKTSSVRMHILYMIIHAQYRSKLFDKALTTILLFQEGMERATNAIIQKYEGRIILLSASIEMYQGNIDTAINQLYTIINHSKYSSIDRYNAILNAGIYHFFRKEYDKPAKLLIELGHTDRWFQKTMGVEWVFKKNIMEVILFYDKGDIDLCENKIRSIETIFLDLKKNPIYARGFIFLKLVKELIKSADLISLEEKVENSFEWLPINEEDLQAMAFYAWIKSKVSKIDYYTCVMALVNQN